MGEPGALKLWALFSLCSRSHHRALSRSNVAAGLGWQDLGSTLGTPSSRGDLVFLPPPTISLPSWSPWGFVRVSCQYEGFPAGRMWTQSGTGGSAGLPPPMPWPHPWGGRCWDVSLGHADVPLSPGAVAEPWCRWLLLEVWVTPQLCL